MPWGSWTMCTRSSVGWVHYGWRCFVGNRCRDTPLQPVTITINLLIIWACYVWYSWLLTDRVPHFLTIYPYCHCTCTNIKLLTCDIIYITCYERIWAYLTVVSLQSTTGGGGLKWSSREMYGLKCGFATFHGSKINQYRHFIVALQCKKLFCSLWGGACPSRPPKWRPIFNKKISLHTCIFSEMCAAHFAIPTMHIMGDSV